MVSQRIVVLPVDYLISDQLCVLLLKYVVMKCFALFHLEREKNILCVWGYSCRSVMLMTGENKEGIL